MPRVNPLKQIVAKQKKGKPVGVYSCCSANGYVIEAALECVKRDDSYVLVEATANQVDQNGGYAGMTPKDFREFVLKRAKATGADESCIFLGGSRLGPLTFAALPEKEAMEKAKELVRCYVAAGLTKIHINTSTRVADDDPDIRLSDAIIAKRGAHLVRIYEETYQGLLKQDPNAVRPVYIVGNEVPIPGGAQGEGTGMQVTHVEDSKATVKTFEEALATEGLKETWESVMGVIIQPDVEKEDGGCTEYDHSKTRDLVASIKEYPNPILEEHSADYQTKFKLRELIEDGASIPKVSPGLTCAIRETLFTLANIETAVYHGKEEALNNFIDVLEEAMMEEPKSRKKYYHGGDNALWFRHKYSFSDCNRYYMPNPNVAAAKDKLIVNLRKSGIPLSAPSQFMSIQYIRVREGHLENDPEALTRDRIINTIDEYLYATCQETLF